jgi:hypothetical protein
MGFSLEAMFKDLERAINEDGNTQDKLNDLIAKIEWWKNYAIQCGNMHK